jgi:hypothetical protein
LDNFLDQNVITLFNLIHDDVSVEMFHVGAVHEYPFCELFVVVHVRGVDDKYEVIGTGHVIALHDFGAFAEAEFELLERTGVAFFQDDVDDAGKTNAGYGGGDDRDVSLDDAIVSEAL